MVCVMFRCAGGEEGVSELVGEGQRERERERESSVTFFGLALLIHVCSKGIKAYTIRSILFVFLSLQNYYPYIHDWTAETWILVRKIGGAFRTLY